MKDVLTSAVVPIITIAGAILGTRLTLQWGALRHVEQLLNLLGKTDDPVSRDALRERARNEITSEMARLRNRPTSRASLASAVVLFGVLTTGLVGSYADGSIVFGSYIDFALKRAEQMGYTKAQSVFLATLANTELLALMLAVAYLVLVSSRYLTQDNFLRLRLIGALSATERVVLVLALLVLALAVTFWIAVIGIALWRAFAQA